MDAPRPGRITAGIAVCLGVGVPFASVGVILGVILLGVGGPPWDDWILDARGVPVDARAIAPPQTDAAVHADRRRYRLTVEVPSAGGPVVTAVWARGGTVESARHGASVPVEMDPANPARARIEGGRASLFGAMALLPFGFALLGVPLAAAGLLLVARRIAFVARAEVVRATVIEARAFGGKGSTRSVDVDLPGGERATVWTTEAVGPGDAVWVARDGPRVELLAPIR